MSEILDRFRGAILGMAVGDALGAAVEFKSPGSFTPVTGMRDGGPWNLDAGYWTDDTSMALCLAASLIEKQGFDPSDQMQRYVRWWQEGYMSSIGRNFDIGTTTAGALRQFMQTGDPYSGSPDIRKSGNGSIMRLAPVPLAYYTDAGEAVRRSADSSRTTHGAHAAVNACEYMAGLIVGALQGQGKERLLSAGYLPDGVVLSGWHPEVAEVAAGSFKRRNPAEIRGTGYVVESLEAALWAFHNSESFDEGVLLTVNLGDDADTTGAVYGQIAGAYYGASRIRQEWLDQLALPELLEEHAEGLFRLSQAERHLS